MTHTKKKELGEKSQKMGNSLQMFLVNISHDALLVYRTAVMADVLQKESLRIWQIK